MGNLKIVNDRDRDWPIKAVGITGLKKNFGRDGGIEEPYWGPSLVGPGDRDDLERNPKKEWGDRIRRRGKWPKKSREEGEKEMLGVGRDG